MTNHSNESDAAQDCLASCGICLSPLDTSESLTGADAIVTRCGHAFHIACLAKHVLTKCQEARERVDAELQPFQLDGMNFRELRRQQRTRQCPKCGYGPVINQHCNDLAAHDVMRGNGEVTNSCGKCGFFSASWNDWAVWDPEAPFAAALCPLCNDACRIAPEHIFRVKAQYDEACQYLNDLPKELGDSMALAADLIVLILFLHAELQEFNDERWDLEILEHMWELALQPTNFHNFLSGPLRGPLQQLLAFEEDHAARQRIVAHGLASKCDTLTATNAVVGARVRRGPDWHAGDEDEWGPGTVERVIASKSGAVVNVKWDAGGRGFYQAGQGHTAEASEVSLYELVLCQEAQQTSNSSNSPHAPLRERVNREILELCVRGDPGPQNGMDELRRRLEEVQNNRRHSALLLSCVRDQLTATTARTLGQPWLPQNDRNRIFERKAILRDLIQHALPVPHRHERATRIVDGFQMCRSVRICELWSLRQALLSDVSDTLRGLDMGWLPPWPDQMDHRGEFDIMMSHGSTPLPFSLFGYRWSRGGFPRGFPCESSLLPQPILICLSKELLEQQPVRPPNRDFHDLNLAYRMRRSWSSLWYNMHTEVDVHDADTVSHFPREVERLQRRRWRGLNCFSRLFSRRHNDHDAPS